MTGGSTVRTHAERRGFPGFLEDQAAVALGFLALHQLTFDRTWLDRACELADGCVSRFRDEATGEFYDAASDAEALVARPRDITDNATPAGSSLAAELPAADRGTHGRRAGPRARVSRPRFHRGINGSSSHDVRTPARRGGPRRARRRGSRARGRSGRGGPSFAASPLERWPRVYVPSYGALPAAVATRSAASR